MSAIGELVVEVLGAAVEAAADLGTHSRSRRVRWTSYGCLFVVVALIVAVLIMAFSE